MPSLILTNILMTLFVASRLAHTAAYMTGQRHEVRATFFTIGSVVVIFMAVYAFFVALA